VTLANLTPQSAFSQLTSINSRHEIEVTGSGLTTVVPGVIHRLVASDQVRVDVLVSVTQSSGNATIWIKDSSGKIFSDAAGWPISPLQESWPPDAKVLSTHETPTWVRYGITLYYIYVIGSLRFLSVEPSEIWHFVSLDFERILTES
jgi:alpha-L-fucosidase